MLNSDSIRKLNLIFKSLPENIRAWLTSEVIEAEITSISAKFNLKENQELNLSRLLLSLVTQYIKPENLISETTQTLSVEINTATNIVKELEEKILKPIKSDLLSIGVDIALLGFKTPVINEPAKDIKIPPLPKTKLPETESPSPFVIHEERGLKSATEETGAGSSFVFKGIPNTTTRSISKPTKVTIERVVHYSNFYTPLNKAPLRYYQKVKIPKSKWFL